MKNILKAEELAQLIIAIMALTCFPLGIPWWLWPVLFLAPDLSMLGYLAGAKAGAVCYNLAHHKGLSIMIIIAGWSLHLPAMVVSGLLLFAHSSFDRMLGYGLKFGDSFQHTHLGTIGKK